MMKFSRLSNLLLILVSYCITLAVSTAAEGNVSATATDISIDAPAETEDVVYLQGGSPIRTFRKHDIYSLPMEAMLLGTSQPTTMSTNTMVLVSAQTWIDLQHSAMVIGMLISILTVLVTVIWLFLKVCWLFLVFVVGPTCVYHILYQLCMYRGLLLGHHATMKGVVVLGIVWLVHDLLRRRRQQFQVGPFKHRIKAKSTHQVERLLNWIAVEFLDSVWELLLMSMATPHHRDNCRRRLPQGSAGFPNYMQLVVAKWKRLLSRLIRGTKSLMEEINLLYSLHRRYRRATNGEAAAAWDILPLMAGTPPPFHRQQQQPLFDLYQISFEVLPHPVRFYSGINFSLPTSTSRLLLSKPVGTSKPMLKVSPQTSLGFYDPIGNMLLISNCLPKQHALSAPRALRRSMSFRTTVVPVRAMPPRKPPVLTTTPPTQHMFTYNMIETIAQQPILPLTCLPSATVSGAGRFPVWGSTNGAPLSVRPKKKTSLAPFASHMLLVVVVEVVGEIPVYLSGTKSIGLSSLSGLQPCPWLVRSCWGRPYYHRRVLPYQKRYNRPGKQQRDRKKRQAAKAAAAARRE